MNAIDLNGYYTRGFAIVSQAVAHEAIDRLLASLVDLVAELGGRRFPSAHSPELADFLNARKDVQSLVYDQIRKPPWLEDFSRQPGIVDAVRQVLGPDIGLLRKIPFRIDAPRETAQFAVWHQDYYYVRGSVDTVTAWVPMQDTAFLHGCLAVMPGSHLLGPLDHDVEVLGKRHYPSNIFDREVRYVEMRKGDVLLFHSCLLHSSSLNLSDVIRFSMQPRYARLGEPVDPGMGDIVSLAGVA